MLNLRLGQKQNVNRLRVATVIFGEISKLKKVLINKLLGSREKGDMIKIHMFKAGYGDSFLVQLMPETKNSINLMVDCGFNYKNNILPKLKDILNKDDTIHRFIITHYDSDHIQGASSLIKDNGNYSGQQMFNIEQVWLNTFRHLQFSKRNTEELDKEEKDKVRKYVSEISSNSITENDEGDIGAKQASLLGQTILDKKYPWNIDTDKEAICIETLKEVNLSKDVKLHLLSPNKERLQNLESEFISKLSEMGLNPNTESIFDDAFELFNMDNKEDLSNEGNISSSCIPDLNSRTIKIFSKGKSYEKDTSIGNGSSISFILETNEQKILFLADAFAEDVIEGLKNKYTEDSEYPIFFDAIKISHHGSFRNNNPELFSVIDSDYFLFSTNGKHPKHKHPDVETIACIINRELPKEILNRNLIFNYELDHLKGFHDEKLKTEFNYQIKTQVETEI